MKWKDIRKKHTFKDGSVMIQKHALHSYPCGELNYVVNDIPYTFIASYDHLFKIDITQFPIDARLEIKEYCTHEIPLKENITYTSDVHLTAKECAVFERYLNGGPAVKEINDDVYELNDKIITVSRFVTASESQKIDDNTYWMPLSGIAYLTDKYGSLTSKDVTFSNVVDKGNLDCFCISTDTGQYTCNHLTSHNSVLIQNIIQHALAHNNKIKLLLVDPKLTEFSNYDGHKGVCAVTNSTKETCEALRIARLVMHERNKELKNLGLKKVAEFTPTKKSGRVFVTGREYNEDDIIDVRVNGEETQMTAAELVELCKKGAKQ